MSEFEGGVRREVFWFMSESDHLHKLTRLMEGPYQIYLSVWRNEDNRYITII